MDEKIGVAEIRLGLKRYTDRLSKIAALLDEAALYQEPPSDGSDVTPNDILLFESTMRDALMHAKFLEKDAKTLREVIGMVTFEDK